MDMEALARMEALMKCANPATMDITICPGLQPPQGVIPMDPNAYSLRPAMIAITVISFVLLFPAVGVRTFTRGYLLKSLGVEDYSVLGAFMGCIAFVGLMVKGFDYNCGKHQWHVSISDTMEVLKHANWTQLLYAPPIFFAKLALLMQIARIFSVGQRNITFWASWGLIVANFVTYFIVMFLFIFECSPRRKIWNPTIDGKCIDTGNAVIATSVVNLISDLTILFLPLFSIWGLQMPLKKKIGVMAIFAIGVLACAAGIARIYYTVKILDTKDVTFWAAVVGMWSVAELTIVILCCCFPTFPRFILFLRGKDGSPKLSYASTPRVGQSSGQSHNLSKSSGKSQKKNPWSLYETNTSTLQGEEMGPYVPLDERKVAEKKSQGSNGSKELHDEWFGQSKEGGNMSILRTTDIETASYHMR